MLMEASNTLEDTSHQTYDGMREVEATVDSITTGANLQAEDAKKASDNVKYMGNLIIETGRAADELNESADQMKQSSDAAVVTIDELKRISEEVKAAVATIAEQTKQTNISAQSIQKASQFISEIASQTNLLSLNASIEAARAGEAGKGFAVVASEIQKLAEQSDTASGNIGEIVNTLIGNSQRVVETMGKTQEIIEKQNMHIESTEQMVNGVMGEIDASIERIRQIETRTKKLESARTEIIDVIDSLSEIAQQNVEGTTQTSSSQRLRTVFRISRILPKICVIWRICLHTISDILIYDKNMALSCRIWRQNRWKCLLFLTRRIMTTQQKYMKNIMCVV